MIIKQLHDQISNDYESGNFKENNFNPQYQKFSRNKLNKRIIVTTTIVGLIFLISSFIVSGWLFYLSIILCVCNFVGSIYFSSKLLSKVN